MRRLVAQQRNGVEHETMAGRRDTPPAIPARIAVGDPHQLLSQVTSSARNAFAPDPLAPRWYLLNLHAQALRLPASFNTLLAPQVLYDRVRPHPYQVRVVEQVLREKAPSAILADEVGLGKTIEAGLIFKKLAPRGIVRSALVLAPKALLSQGQGGVRAHCPPKLTLAHQKGLPGFPHEGP